MDDVRIYNYARSQAQVAWDYNRGQPFAKYNFDECTGSVIHNYAVPPTATWSAQLTWGTFYPGSSGNTSAGTCQSGSGTEAWNNGKTGKFNSSLDFDGTDDMVQIIDNNFGNVSGDFTISTWVKTSQPAASNSWPALISKEIINFRGYELILHNETVDARWSGAIYVGGTEYTVYGATNVADGTWHHLVFQRSGSTLRTYQDGKLANTTSNVSAADLTNGTSLTIGDTSHPVDTAYDGQLDDVMLFNYALSPAQIRVLHNQNAAVRFGPVSGRP